MGGTGAMAMRSPDQMHEPRSFATEGSYRPWRASQPRPWWGDLVPDDARLERLIRKVEANRVEIERVRMGQSSHERVCAERYKRIEENTTNLKQGQERISGEVAKALENVNVIEKTVVAADGNMSKRLLGVAIAAITLLLGALAWQGGQLYALEPLRVQHETKK